MIDQHDCKYCHKSATHYSVFRNEYAYLCDEKKCVQRFDVESGYFIMTINVNSESK